MLWWHRFASGGNSVNSNNDKMIPEAAGVVFSIHAVLLTLFTLLEIAIYDISFILQHGHQKVLLLQLQLLRLLGYQ
ncbi:hypothetical protein ACH5RR_033926 [Cinchona calisaya]|uniref:Uncharacterized protein n=1 Tax=Cinchona calisaya TaxID=153742 RepID=A0ABD2YE19_9GENT